MFGLSGSGKTTFSKRLERFDFQRLSVDEEIWNKFGKFGIDYKKEEYKELQIVANRELYIRFLELLKCNQNIVVDFSFWQKENRDNYKQIVEDNTGKWFLVYMNTSISVIKTRLKIRNERFDANAAFPITDSILNIYLESFQIPEHENQFEIITDN